ncbi:TIGR00730 family Rossman fold protein [Burkholderia gladioli]|jgi:uncharacterized protein (TIGR00730 family)|uniref:LOG family protein n=1 Tax=Burkholderia gladioli TaxID=28095 RepID=UPI001364AD43|nr:TIGR00730 family Rossman fold protein [Burkholderia gladioli]KAF1062411.1 Cytokinin riboside 5'-monophosphate phosphoribohydrolase [Burkholderia gladioli]MBU9641172.1 TIGR00730 family Rossman fold protein [Burkholderia gladioli]WAG18727.1 TIGR00730 family Rossman fold protein [Burkholderia gladioli]
MADKEVNSQPGENTGVRAVCVYCGSSPGADPAFMEASEALGRALARARLKLVYGGGTTGLMGAVARGALDAGGEVGAVIPRFLIDREANQASLTMFEDLTITDTMHERKHRMFERSDAFVALPGGIGTVEEIVEIMTWSQLGRHRKPIVLVNTKGFWNPLLALLDHLREAGFIHSGHLLQPILAERVEDVVPAILEAAVPAGTSSEGEPSIVGKR